MNNEQKIEAIAKNFTQIMLVLGLNIHDASLKDTPMRVAKMYVNEFCLGLDAGNKPKMTLFPNDGKYDQIVLVKDIHFVSMCEHHFVPIEGKAHVAYIPDENVIGLSKINRLVKFHAARPQLQERLNQDIANDLKHILGTEDIAVILNARHHCCASRGVKDINSSTTTSVTSGNFRGAQPLNELFELIKIKAF